MDIIEKNAYKMISNKCFFNIMHMYRMYLYMCVCVQVYVFACVCICTCVREPPRPFQFSLSPEQVDLIGLSILLYILTAMIYYMK